MNLIKYIGLALILLFVIINMFLLFHNNESFFSVKDVIKDHLKLFHNCKLQYIIFYLNPLIFAIGLSMVYEAGETFYTNLSVVVSVLLSMLLAILSILTEKDYSSIKDSIQSKNIKRVTQETITAIVFDSMLCIFLLLYGLVMIVIDGIAFNIEVVRQIFAFIAYYVFAVMLLNLLLIVKRMSRIFEFDFDVQKGNKK